MAAGRDGFLAQAEDGTSFPKFQHPSFVQHATQVQEVVEEVVEDTISSRRRACLIEQAESRAEQQALARVTMLDLARELEEAIKTRRELHMQLMEERREKDQMRLAAEAAEVKLNEALQAAEDAKVEHMRDKLRLASLQGSSLAVAVLWSRRAVHLDRLGGDDGMTEEERAKDNARQEDVDREVRLAEGGPDDEDDPDGEGDGGAEERKRDVRATKAKEWAALAVPGLRSRGDGITMMWILRAWREQINNGKLQRAQGDENLSRLAALEEQMRKMREGFERSLESERSKNRALEGRVQGLLEELEKMKRRCDLLEKEKNDLLREFCGGDGAENPFELAKRRVKELEALLLERDAKIAEQEQTIRDLEAAMARQKQEFEDEKRRLKAQIREMAAELQRQIIFAKHLREVALKAKRDASGSISPEKMAQLIADLEDMRDRLTYLGSEADRERYQCNVLKGKLEQNSRRLELERQFLPLLHKVRGPVGPKHALLQKQPQSQSTGALGGLDGSPGSMRDARMASRQELAKSLPGVARSRADF